jgi:hypothetical protein
LNLSKPTRFNGQTNTKVLQQVRLWGLTLFRSIVALDWEMVEVTGRKSSLGRVTIVDEHGNIEIDEFVRVEMFHC